MPRRRKDFKLVTGREMFAVFGVVFMLAAGIYAGSAALIGRGGTRAAAVSSQPFVYACFGDTSGKANTGLQEFAPACKAGGHLKRIATEDVSSTPPTTSTSSPPTSTSAAPTSTSTSPVTTTTQAPGGGVQPPPGGGTCGTADQPSIYPGVTLTLTQAVQAAYAGGFHTVSEIQTIVGIGWAESNRVTLTRNWHPEFGYRPASDVLGVQGPASVWCNGRQFHADRGWLQISSHYWPQFTDGQTDNPTQAAAAAHSIYTHGDGTGFGQWNTAGSSKAVAGRPTQAQVCATVPATGC